MINVLVADDSALMRKIDCDIINAVQDFSVGDTAFDEKSTLKKLQDGDYQILVFCMGLLKQGNGSDFMKNLNALGKNVKVVAISYPIQEERTEARHSFKDAVFFIRPFHMSMNDRTLYEKNLVDAMKNAAKKGHENGSSMLKKKENVSASKVNFVSPSAKAIAEGVRNRKTISNGPYQLVALACSTGGPQALHKVIPMITRDLPVPFVIVQHMPYGFTEPLAKRLDEKSRVNVKEAHDGEILKKNTVYFAPGGRHLEIENDASLALKAKVYDGEPVNSLKPCADVMYESLINCSVNNILCVVLTGMGMDGTVGIVRLSKEKNTYVISQDAKSSVVYGMPRAIAEAGMSNEVVPLENVAQSIMKKLGV